MKVSTIVGHVVPNFKPPELALRTYPRVVILRVFRAIGFSEEKDASH